jgi:hypothetical protein
MSFQCFTAGIFQLSVAFLGFYPTSKCGLCAVYSCQRLKDGGQDEGNINFPRFPCSFHFDINYAYAIATVTAYELQMSLAYVCHMSAPHAALVTPWRHAML